MVFGYFKFLDRNIISLKGSITNTEAVIQMCSIKKGALKYFAKFTRKSLIQSLFFQAWGLQLYQKKTLAQVFRVNFAKFLRTSFLQNTSGRMLLKIFHSHSWLSDDEFSHMFISFSPLIHIYWFVNSLCKPRWYILRV